MKLPLIFSLAAFLLILPANNVFAAVTPKEAPVCTPILNGGPTCRQSDLVEINKKVLNPKIAANKGATFTDADFVENVTQKDTRYTPNTPTAFRIYITNKTNRELKDIVVSDVFPQNFLTFITGNGTFDSNTHTFTTKVTLEANQTKAITVQVLTAMTDDILKSNAPVCTINVATAVVNNKTSQDNSMLCVDLPERVAGAASFPPQTAATQSNPSQTKGGLPVVSPVTPNQLRKAPSTGPEMLALVGLIPAGFLGHFLRKKSA